MNWPVVHGRHETPTNEPHSNLDAKLRVQMRAELNKLHEKLETTTVYVTHDQIEAMTMADQIAVMSDGRIQQVGDPTFVYENPANTFVADFLGSPSTDLIDGRVNRRGDALVFEAGSIEADVPERYRESLAPRAGERVTLGVRPENVRFGDGGHPAEVTVVEPQGEKTVLELAVAEAGTIHASVEPGVSVSTGDRVELQFDRDRLHYFDPGTGESLTFTPPEGRPREADAVVGE